MDEIGFGVGTTEQVGGLIVGPGCFLRGVESSEPHPDLLGGVLDFRHPFARWALSDSDKFASIGVSAVGITKTPFLGY